MFSMKQSFQGYTMPVPLLYVDTLNEAYTFENLVIQATDADEALTLLGVTALCSFEGDPFPLSGADYLTEVQGTLRVTVTQALPTGKHVFPFMSQSAELLPCVGLALHGLGVFGVPVTLLNVIGVSVVVQSFTIQGVPLAPPAQGGQGVPVLHG
jgi:hypothetical protein